MPLRKKRASFAMRVIYAAASEDNSVEAAESGNHNHGRHKEFLSPRIVCSSSVATRSFSACLIEQWATSLFNVASELRRMTVYLLVPRQIKHAENDRVASCCCKTILAIKENFFMAAMIMVSHFRLPQRSYPHWLPAYINAMQKDALFFRKASVLNKNGSPAKLAYHAMHLGMLLCFSGTYGQLLNYIMFATLLFYILTISGLFKLRMTQPNLHRPYKLSAIPSFPLSILFSPRWFGIDMLIYQPTQSLWDW